jgi:hypothetical protein
VADAWLQADGRGRDGGVRQELAAGAVLRSGGRSAFGGKPENIYSFRALLVLPSRPGEFHPEPLTEPDLSLSTYPARTTA